jgi:hypothetical protein
LVFITATVQVLLQAELCAEHLVEFPMAAVLQVLVVLIGKAFLEIQVTGFVAHQEA